MVGKQSYSLAICFLLVFLPHFPRSSIAKENQAIQFFVCLFVFDGGIVAEIWPLSASAKLRCRDWVLSKGKKK